MELPVLINPGKVLRRYTTMTAGHRTKFLAETDYRYLEILLPIETKRRLIMGAVGSSLLALSKEEIATVLRSVIQESGHEALVDEWYNFLLEWSGQDVTFEPVSFAGVPEAMQPRGGSTDE